MIRVERPYMELVYTDQPDILSGIYGIYRHYNPRKKRFEREVRTVEQEQRRRQRVLRMKLP